MIADEPAIAEIGTAARIVPTDAPEADGTRAWNETTLVPVTVPGRKRAGDRLAYAAVAVGAADLLSRAVVGRSAVDVPDRALDPEGGDAQ